MAAPLTSAEGAAYCRSNGSSVQVNAFRAFPGALFLGAATLLSFGACSSAPPTATRAYYPDSQGWNRKALQGDEFEAFLPLRVQNDLYLISPEEQAVFDPGKPATPGAAFVEFRDNRKIPVGSSPQQFVTILKARRAFYGHVTLAEMPVFKVWVEQVSAEDFPRYKEGIQRTVRRYESNRSETDSARIDVTTSSHKGHEYYLYLRGDLSFEGLKNKNSIGGLYVLFPEGNVVVFISFFNTRYTSADAYMVSKDDVQSIARQFIDSAAH